jgi:sugar diacid utilization regulator
VVVEQLTAADVMIQASRLGIRHLSGPATGPAIVRVELVDLDALTALSPGTLAVVLPAAARIEPYRLDIAVRQASARGLAALVFVENVRLPDTATALSDRGGVPILSAAGARASDLAFALDRLVSGGASEIMTRAAFTIEEATRAAAEAGTRDVVLEAASSAAGVRITLVEDPDVTWMDSDAVCIGDVPIGRLVPERSDPAVAIALPVIASVLSRTLQREMRERFAPTQSRADLIVELVLAESSRVEGFLGQAARLGLPLHLSHVAGWLTPTQGADSGRRPSPSVQPALELFALQLVDRRDELWHIAFIQDDALILSTEEPGAGDHQRRLREVSSAIQAQANALAGGEWEYTLGLGTPLTGPAGLRQSAAEARVAAESAIAAGRTGSVQVTDVTGLRRVLLDFYASPTSRSLLHDILQPLDDWGPERATTAARTLLSYLGHRNSLGLAGRELNLHPNGVAHRLKRIREALGVDLDDPDTRFAVELACRVRLLGTSERAAAHGG